LIDDDRHVRHVLAVNRRLDAHGQRRFGESAANHRGCPGGGKKNDWNQERQPPRF